MSSISNVFGAGGASGMGNVTMLTPQSGGSVLPIAGNINIIPTTSSTGVLTTINGGANNLDIGLTASTDGQLIIGAPGGAGWATLTAGTNISITNGANSITISSSPSSVNYTLVTFADSPYTVLPSDYYISVDLSGGAITILLPNTTSTGRILIIKDQAGISSANNITVTTVGGAVGIDGSLSFVMNTDYESIQLIFNGASYEVF